MADSLRYKDWFDKAKNDLQGARILFDHEADFSLVAFHCQQTMEKGLKGFILQHTKDIVEGHSLVYLCKKACAIDADIRRFMEDGAYVNQFYIETRYPADVADELDRGEAEDCLRMAEKLLQALCP